ncbi:hypothetical protein LRP50_23830 [Enterovibrio sp. ZSDZ42]|uniref:Uncharacterized protein n=1 Tax=Enterovibrio gelatinilyticus TaxID=2899819 RepID=A0ABT5R7C3_9GAMM|nr:hypothetical protein [Enterovibrio sp. ZSDZ42]MDD1796156.1 hypothetical protein [Enterovibrio sp. ZSDZ42]
MQFFKQLNNNLIGKLHRTSEFQQRMWIVNVRENTLNNDTFVISEDSFSEPMQWMKRHNYDDYMIDELDQLKLSESATFKIGNTEHCLFRVK